MMVLFPLTFLSNVFVEPDTMPGWLRAFTEVNPITHLVAATRGLMQGNPDAGEITWVLVSGFGDHRGVRQPDHAVVQPQVTLGSAAGSSPEGPRRCRPHASSSVNEFAANTPPTDDDCQSFFGHAAH